MDSSGCKAKTHADQGFHRNFCSLRDRYPPVVFTVDGQHVSLSPGPIQRGYGVQRIHFNSFSFDFGAAPLRVQGLREPASAPPGTGRIPSETDLSIVRLLSLGMLRLPQDEAFSCARQASFQANLGRRNPVLHRGEPTTCQRSAKRRYGWRTSGRGQFPIGGVIPRSPFEAFHPTTIDIH